MSVVSRAIPALVRVFFAVAVLFAPSAPLALAQEDSRPATMGQFDRLEGKVDSLEEKVDAQGKRLDALTAKVDAQGERLDALTAKVEKLTEIVTELSKNVAVLAAKMEEQGKRMDDMLNRMDGMQTQMDRMHGTLNNIFYAIIAGLFVLLGVSVGALLHRREPKPAAPASSAATDDGNPRAARRPRAETPEDNLQNRPLSA